MTRQDGYFGKVISTKHYYLLLKCLVKGTTKELASLSPHCSFNAEGLGTH